MGMKAKRVSKIARGKHAKAVVFHGSKEKTLSGLTKAALHKNKRGKIVSKKSVRCGQETLPIHQRLDQGRREGQKGAGCDRLLRGWWQNSPRPGPLRQGQVLLQRVNQ